MSALFVARHLLALLASPQPPDGGGVGKCAATVRASHDETCDMPLGDAGTCGLPADHADGCALRVVCLCSHADVLHDEVGCVIFVCGCRVLRPKQATA